LRKLRRTRHPRVEIFGLNLSRRDTFILATNVMHTPDSSFLRTHCRRCFRHDLAFAFSDANLLVGGSDAAPTVPTLDELGAIGIDGVRITLASLPASPCVAIGLANSISAPPISSCFGLRTLFFPFRKRCSQSPRAHSRSSSGSHASLLRPLRRAHTRQSE